MRVQAARRAEFARDFPEQAAMEAEAREVFDEFDVRAPGLLVDGFHGHGEEFTITV